MTYEIELQPAARRALTHELPEGAAAAAWEFVTGPLADNPHRVGKPLRFEFEGYHSARRGAYRVIYQIVEDRVVVLVVRIDHRRDVYRG